MKDPSNVNASYINEKLEAIESQCHYDMPRLPEDRVPSPGEIQDIHTSLTQAATEGGQIRNTAKTLQDDFLGTGDGDDPYSRFDADR